MENLAALFFDTARAHPARPALVLEDRTLSYGELADRALRVAAALEREGGERVGLFAHRSEGAYTGLLGILAAGAAYVPLNPAFPASRNAYIARKAALRTLVVSRECAAGLRDFLARTTDSYRLVACEAAGEFQALAQEFSDRVVLDVAGPASAGGPVPVPEDATAYVLFTSGSTGDPKGVVVRHRNVRRYLRSLAALHPICPDDRVSQTFDLTFDLSIHDLFTAWSSGAAVVVFSAAALASPIPYARDQGVTVWFSVPSLVALLEGSRLVESNGLPGVRLSFFCGEKLTVNTVHLWRSVAPASRIVNLYGPTETTIAITHFEVPVDLAEPVARQGAVPLGDALPGQKIEIRREDGTLAPLGEPGVLFLGGDQVAAGYLDEPALTASRFEGTGSEAWYRSGDLALRDARGLVHFLGREDFQVKVQGYRVELGEVEHALMTASGAALAVADVAVLRNGVEELFAVLPSRFAARKKEIREALRGALPPYMLPRLYFFRDDLPLNANGKVDRNALKASLPRDP